MPCPICTSTRCGRRACGARRELSALQRFAALILACGEPELERLDVSTVDLAADCPRPPVSCSAELPRTPGRRRSEQHCAERVEAAPIRQSREAKARDIALRFAADGSHLTPCEILHDSCTGFAGTGRNPRISTDLPNRHTVPDQGKRTTAPSPGRRSCTYPPRSKDLCGFKSRPGHHQRSRPVPTIAVVVVEDANHAPESAPARANGACPLKKGASSGSSPSPASTYCATNNSANPATSHRASSPSRTGGGVDDATGRAHASPAKTTAAAITNHRPVAITFGIHHRPRGDPVTISPAGGASAPGSALVSGRRSLMAD